MVVCRSCDWTPKAANSKPNRVLDDRDPASGKSIQLLSSQSIMPSANPDILSCDATASSCASKSCRTTVGGLARSSTTQATQYNECHVFSWAGFLEDSWMHRLYMSYGNGKLPLGTYLNWWEYGQKNPDGRLLVTDDNRVFSYGLKPQYHAWSSTFLDYQLFSVNKKVETEPMTGPTIFGAIRVATRPPPRSCVTTGRPNFLSTCEQWSRRATS